MARQEDPDGDPVIAAIERVLKSEQAGAEQLRASQERGQQLLAEARARAQAIEMRADARISRLHADYLQKLQRDIDTLAQSYSPRRSDGDAAYRARLAKAARLVAATLIGGA